MKLWDLFNHKTKDNVDEMPIRRPHSSFDIRRATFKIQITPNSNSLYQLFTLSQ